MLNSLRVQHFGGNSNTIWISQLPLSPPNTQPNQTPLTSSQHPRDAYHMHTKAAAAVGEL